MTNYTPVTASEDKFELYNVVYKASEDVDLKDYLKNRNSFKWTPYVKVVNELTGEYKFESLPKLTTKLDINNTREVTNWIDDFKKEYNNSDIYSLIQDKTFTLIIFDSRDYDSILTKDIIVKQYETAYGRDVKDWHKDGVIIYDSFENKSSFTTIDGTNYFDLNCLKETAIDEVFLCGYNIDNNLFKQFARSNERVFVFESNPYKINTIRSLIRTSYDVHFCMSKTSTKAYQAYTLFRDPIGNIKTTDNPGLEILKNYSDINTFSFEDCSQWQQLEKTYKWFEDKVKDDAWREKLVNVLFGDFKTPDKAKKDLGFDEIDSIVIEDNEKFNEDLNNYSYRWTNNVVAVNTREIPTYNQVNQLIAVERKYDQIITFYKNDSDFWIVKAYKVDREVKNGISITVAEPKDKDGVQIIWYTPTGVPVVKVVEYDGVKWYNVSGKRKVNANYYEFDKSGNYIYDASKYQYVEFTWSDDSSDHYPIVNGEKFDNAFRKDGKIQTYKKLDKTNGYPNYITFDIVYADTIDIDFNNLSLIELLRNSYYCQGNKFAITASLNDRQMYECLKTKSILG